VAAAAPNYTAACVAVNQGGATAIQLALGAATAIHVADDCARQGYKPLYTSVDGSTTNSMLADSNLDGMLSAQSTFPWFSAAVPGAAQFQSVIKQYNPSILTSTQFGSNDIGTWAGLQLFAKAAAHLGDSPTANGVIQGLYSLKNETLGGIIAPVTFVAGQIRVPTCYFVMQAKNHQWTLPDGTAPNCPGAGVPH
jgi:branched-chain amino acid transport system substrate-binding protein